MDYVMANGDDFGPLGLIKRPSGGLAGFFGAERPLLTEVVDISADARMSLGDALSALGDAKIRADDAGDQLFTMLETLERLREFNGDPIDTQLNQLEDDIIDIMQDDLLDADQALRRAGDRIARLDNDIQRLTDITAQGL